MKKDFKFGVVLGRFNHMHNGHKYIIDMSRKLCEKTLILIGSAQESGTFRNPFKIETREKIIEEIYGDCEDIIIGRLEDMTNENDICFEWGRYILDNIKEKNGLLPDLMVYGKDESRKGWFSHEDRQKFSEIIVARDKIKISATELRKCLVKNEVETWKKYVPEEIWNMYEDLRKELMQLEEYNLFST